MKKKLSTKLTEKNIYSYKIVNSHQDFYSIFDIFDFVKPQKSVFSVLFMAKFLFLVF